MWIILLKNDIRIGDTVIVYKAGDIIPAVLRVVESKRTTQEPMEVPTQCPSCGSGLLHFGKMKLPYVVLILLVLLRLRKASSILPLVMP